MKKVFSILIMLSLVLLGGCFSSDEDNDDQRNAADLVYPKGLISGVVIDDATKAPIADVRISLGKASVTTDRYGNFSISGLDIGGADMSTGEGVVYNLVSTKENYVNNCASVEFTKDTLVNEDSEVVVEVNATGDLTSNGEELLIGKVVLPLGNATANIQIEMVEKVTVKGSVKAKEGFDLGETVKVKVTIPVDLPESNFENQVSETKNFQIVDVPAYEHLYFGLEVFTDEDDYADFYYSSESLELQNVKREGTNGQRIADIGELEVVPYCEVKGTVYTKYNMEQAVSKGAKVELYSGSYKIGEALTDENGNYSIKEVKPGTYELRLLDFDENSDGQLEYVNGKVYADLVVLYGEDEDSDLGASASTVITRDLWYEGAYNYSVSGKVEAGLVGNTIAGITVKALYENGYDLEVLAETATAADGTFVLSGIQFKNVMIMAEAIDTDNNAVANFMTADKAILNSEDDDILDFYLFMGVNSLDPNYDLKVSETSFSEYIGENLSAKLNEVMPDEDLTITFNKAVSQDSIDYIISHVGEEIVTLSSGAEILDITATFNEERTVLTINPAMPLIADYYEVNLNNILATEEGYKFRVLNNISTLGVDVAIESYLLELANLNFAAKDRTGMWNDAIKLLPDSDIVITFAEALSAESIADIEMAGEKIVSFVPNIDYTYSLDETNTILTISPVEFLNKTGTDTFAVYINGSLSSATGHAYEVGNNIQDLELQVDLEPYQLEVLSGTFIEKDVNTGDFKVTNGTKDRVLSLTFNMAVSQESIDDILNEGDVPAVLMAGATALGTTDVTLSGDGLTMTLTPEVNIETETNYTIALNPNLMSQAGYTYEVVIAGQTAFAGKLVEAINIENLSAIKPELVIPAEYLGVYTKENLFMDSNMTNWFASSLANLEKGTQAYDIDLMPVSIDITDLKPVIDQVGSFDIYAKTDADDSYWTRVKTIGSWTLADVKLGRIETTIDLNNFMGGYDLSDSLRWGEKVYFTVLPVDELGKKASLPAKTAETVLSFEDNIGVELSTITLPNYSSIYNSVYFNEMIDPEANWDVEIAGQNPYIGATVSNKMVATSLQEVKYQLDATAVYIVATAYNISEATNNELVLNSTNGLYDGMILETELGKIEVTGILNTTTIEFVYNTTSFDITASTNFVISRDNSDLYTRMDSTSVYSVNSYSNTAVQGFTISINDGGDPLTGGTITLSGANPLLGMEVGDSIIFEDTNNVEADVTVDIASIVSGTVFTVSTDLTALEVIEASAATTNIYQMTFAGVGNLISGRSLELEHISDGTDKTVAILDQDIANGLVKINGSAENYTARASLVTVNTADDTIILSDIVKYSVGDKIVLDKDSSEIKEADANIELEITAIVPVETVSGVKKYEYAVNEIAQTTDEVEAGFAVEFKPELSITVTAEDSSGNVILTDKDKIVYDIYEASWILE